MTDSALLSYFDLAPPRGVRTGAGRVVRGDAATGGGDPGKPFASQLAQYLALAAGVVAEPFFTSYKQGQAWGFTWQWMIFALLVTIAVFPAVYRRAWDPDKPMFVQLCAIFAAGLGWHTILVTGAKAVSGG